MKPPRPIIQYLIAALLTVLAMLFVLDTTFCEESEPSRATEPASGSSRGESRLRMAAVARSLSFLPVSSDGPSNGDEPVEALAMQRLGSEAPPKTSYTPVGSHPVAGLKPGLGPSEFTGVKRNRWNWKGAAVTYGSGIAFDRLTTELALSRGALETNPWRQSQSGQWRTDALIFTSLMLTDRLLFKVDPKAPKFLRGAAVGIYATRGGLNLRVAF